MKIECSACQKTFEIPEERLPVGKEIVFPCPACKENIKLDLRSTSARDSTSAPQTEETQASGDTLKKAILQSVGDLPPMPQTVFKVREIIANPKSSFKELGDILETDQAMATKVLKIANSSYYGLAGKVSTLKQASVVLGHKTIGDLMTMASTSGLLGNNLEGYELDAGDLWRHSLGVAIGSKIIANMKAPALAEDAFAAGLIHDAGKLILDKYVLERAEAFKEYMADGKQSFLNAEKHILGFDHSEIASEACKSWHVPQTLTVAIRYHHYPSESQEDKLTYIVHVADAIAMMTGLGLGRDGMLYRMDDKAMEFLGIEVPDISTIMSEVVESVENIAQ